jgi:hypothetical protein
MAYYSALVTAWESVTQPPTGVTGTALTGSMTTLQKIAAVNAWTVATEQPTAILTAAQILGCITSTDFPNFTALELQWLQTLLATFPNGEITTTNTGPVATLGALIFAGKTTTLANLNALFTAALVAAIPWYQANGYPGPFNLADTQLAGLT